MYTFLFFLLWPASGHKNNFMSVYSYRHTYVCMYAYSFALSVMFCIFEHYFTWTIEQATTTTTTIAITMPTTIAVFISKRNTHTHRRPRQQLVAKLWTKLDATNTKQSHTYTHTYNCTYIFNVRPHTKNIFCKCQKRNLYIYMYVYLEIGGRAGD